MTKLEKCAFTCRAISKEFISMQSSEDRKDKWIQMGFLKVYKH